MLGTFFYIQQSSIPSAENVSRDISRAETLIESDKLGQAESALEMVEKDLEHHPDLRRLYRRARQARNRATHGQRCFYEEDGDVDQAIAAYKEVLSRNPRHESARERLHAIRAERQSDESGAFETGLAPRDLRAARDGVHG